MTKGRPAATPFKLLRSCCFALAIFSQRDQLKETIFRTGGKFLHFRRVERRWSITDLDQANHAEA